MNAQLTVGYVLCAWHVILCNSDIFWLYTCPVCAVVGQVQKYICLAYYV